jgi:hypothetical protein
MLVQGRAVTAIDTKYGGVTHYFLFSTLNGKSQRASKNSIKNDEVDDFGH